MLVLGLSPSKRLGKKSPTIRKLYDWLDVLGLDIVSFSNISSLMGSSAINVKDIDYKYVKEISKHYEKIITLGITSDRILNIMGIDHFSLPHPSGLNRQLNDSDFATNALKKCKDYLWK